MSVKKIIYCLLFCVSVVIGSYSTVALANNDLYWSDEKTAVYRPLLGQTLQWSGDVMQSGGFDVETGTIVTDKTKADVVMNIYGAIGARQIAKLDTFAQPTVKGNIVFPRDGLGDPIRSMTMQENEMYVIVTSNGDYMQLRIDRIVAGQEVRFTYVTEAEAPITENVDDFTEMPQKYTRDAAKVWTVQFSEAVKETTINDKTVYVKNAKGYIVATRLRLSYDNKAVYISPTNAYVANDTYTIYVTKDIQNTAGKSLTKGSLMKFVLDTTGQYPDTTAPQQLYGLYVLTDGDNVTLRLSSSNALDVAGYRVYYRISGEQAFTKLLKNGKDELYYTSDIALTGISNVQGKTVEFYATAVDRSGNESIPSEIVQHTFTTTPSNPNPDPTEAYSRFFKNWSLELAYVPFGQLQISANGTYRWTGAPHGTSSGNWEVRSYGFVLVKADGQSDYIVTGSDRNPADIKLLVVTDGKYTDGSPISLYYADGK